MESASSSLSGILSIKVVILERDVLVRLSGTGFLSGLSRNFTVRRENLLIPAPNVRYPTVEEYTFGTTVTVEAEDEDIQGNESSSDYESSVSSASEGEDN